MSALLSCPPNIDQILQVIGSLYHKYDNKNESKEMASKWLESIQNSVYAWEIADQLLIKKQDIESCYFAAQTLRTKLQSSFNELPQDSIFSLKNSILNHLKNINESVIQTQLALSITYLVILVPSWTNPIEEIVSSELNRYVIVEILTLLPEELDQSRHQNLKNVGINRKQQIIQYLTRISPQVISLLNVTLIDAQRQLMDCINQGESEHGCAQQSAEKLIAKVYRCLGVWLNIINHSNINCIEPILNSIFASLQDPCTADVVHDAAADTICSTALLCEKYENYKHLTHYLLNQIYQLEGVYHHSVSNEDIDKSVNYSRIFTEMAESILSPLLIDSALKQTTDTDSGLKLVNLLLDCINHYEYEVAEITFHFWYRLSELIDKQDSYLTIYFSPVINRLLLGLTAQCQLDSDQEGILGPESELQEFRVRVKDLIKEVVVIVGAREYMHSNEIVSKLQNALSRLSIDPSDWEEVEASLFMISSLINYLYEDPNLINEIIKVVMFTSIQNQQHSIHQGNRELAKPFHPQILATCCTILSELACWLKNQPSNVFNLVLNYLIPLITSEPPTNSNNEIIDHKSETSGSLSSISADSLQQITECCASKHLVGNNSVIKVLISICTQLDVLNEKAAQSMLHSCSTIISQNSELSSRQDQEDLIVKLLIPNIECLKRLLAETQHGLGKFDPKICLDRISAVFKDLHLKPSTVENRQSSLNQTVHELWQLINAILNHTSSSNDAKVVDKTCRCLRHIIRCLRPPWLLIPVAECIVTLYQNYPKHSSYLYLASILVDEFGDPNDSSINAEDREKIDNGLVSMLEAFCVPTFTLLTEPDVQLKNYPDTIDDFFRLCNRFLDKNPFRFFSFSMINSILNLTLASLQLEDRDANGSVCKFIVCLINSGKESSFLSITREMVDNILTNANEPQGQCYGQKLVTAVINAALFHLPSYFIPEMSDILWKLMDWDKTKFLNWLQHTLQSLPLQSNASVAMTMPQNLQEFYDTLSKANNIKFVVSSLRFLSRLYR